MNFVMARRVLILVGLDKNILNTSIKNISEEKTMKWYFHEKVIAINFSLLLSINEIFSKTETQM